MYRVTLVGARLVSTTVGPAKIVVSELPHALALLDLVEELVEAHPDAELTTERELRGERYRALRDGARDAGRGRMPDAQLTFPDGKIIAVELDLTPKRERLYAQHVRDFARQPFCVWWWVPSETTARRLKQVVEREYVADRIQVFVRPQ